MRLAAFVLRWFPVFMLVILGAGPVTAAPPPGMAPPAAAVNIAIPPVLKNAPQLAQLLKSWDSESALAVEVQRQAPRKVISRAEMRGIQVETGTGERVDLGSLFDRTFEAQDRLGRQLERIPAGALAGRPQLNEAVVEFPDRLLMVRQVRAVIRDPKQAAAAVPEIADFLAPVDHRAVERARVADLPADEQADFRRFLREELPLLDAEDPLRLALASGGEDAVLRAAYSGAGVFGVTDQVVVERRLFSDGSMRLSAPLKMQARQSGAFQPVRPAVQMQPSKSSLAGPGQGGRQYLYEGGERATGRLEISEKFLAGFTLGQELTWERRWDWSFGFLRLTYGIGYGFGLRIPLKVEGSLRPTRIERSAVEDPGRELTLVLRAVACDADVDHYRDVGLPEGKLFGGQEFVLEAGSWFSYKLYALGRDWIKGSPVNNPLVQSCDFTPPLGGTPREVFSIDIPPEVTDTVLPAGVLDGYLQLGFVLRASGSAMSRLGLLVDSAEVDSRALEMRGTGGLTEVLDLLPLSGVAPGAVVQQRYGLLIAAPAYRMDLTPTARVRVGVSVHVSEFKRSINTPWIEVASFSLGSIVLPPHAGTRSSYQWNDGVRIFEARDPSDSPTMNRPTVAPGARPIMQ